MGKKYLSFEDSLSACNGWDQVEQDTKDKIHARLHARCELDSRTGCWVYTGAWDKRGQGIIRVGKCKYTLPRVSAWLYIPGFHLEDPRYAFRTCECSACFNPAHVRIAKDRRTGLAILRALGRFGRGHRKLNQQTADMLRLAYANRPPSCDRDGFIRRQAEGLGVKPQAVRAIIDNLTWVKREQARSSGAGRQTTLRSGGRGLPPLHQAAAARCD